MARLPQPGGDSGNWGEILNDYLSQSLDVGGGLKNDIVGAPQLKPQSVTAASIANGNITASKLAAGTAIDNQVLSYNGGDLVWATPSDGSGPISADQITETASNKVLTAAERAKLSATTASATELNYTQGVTSSIQTQLNAKGNVYGPASSTDNAIARFDSTTGKLLKNSTSTILTDSGTIASTAYTGVQFKGVGTAGGNAGGSGVGLYSDSGVAQLGNYRLGFLLFGGATDTIGTLANAGGIFSYADAAWSPTSTPTRIEFEVAPTGSTTRSTAMTIKSSGSIGMGTNSPGAKLEVNGEARVTTAGTAATSVVTVGGTQTLSGKTITGAANTLSGIAQSSVTNLATDLAAKANASTLVANGMGVVVHGATAATVRPTDFAVITWIGSVAPTNAATNDIWVYKA